MVKKVLKKRKTEKSGILGWSVSENEARKYGN